MKVLLSAYACEPNKGSEQEVGWQRAIHMTAHADEVWVVTRANNRQVIEADPLSRTPGLHFLYCDLAPWLVQLKKKAWFLRVYVFLWQWRAYRLAAEQHRRDHFDRVYHVTFVGMVSGSFMGRLGVPLILGPIAGGERAPLAMRRSLPLKYWLQELVRDAGILLQRYSPLTRQAFAVAEQIYVATPESRRLVPARWQSKIQVQLAIGAAAQLPAPATARQNPQPNFIFVGRLLHWKGIHLAIRALSKAKAKVPQATLTIVGTGPAESWLRTIVKQCKVEESVKFAGQVPHTQLAASLADYRAMLFPSFHDSGGLVVLEAFRSGLPVICLGLGGPGVMVDHSCGIRVPVEQTDEQQAVERLSEALIAMAHCSPLQYAQLAAGARARADQFSWSSLTDRVVNGKLPSYRKLSPQ